MSKVHYLTTPLTDEAVASVKSGDIVYLTVTVFTARDAAHTRLVALLDEKKELPFDIKGAVIYYVGPTPEKPGEVIGSAGPTTSYRMDLYAPRLLDIGLKGMIGKGSRNKKVKGSMLKNKGIYLAAIGGAAALIAKSIKESKIIAYEDLGPEAVRQLRVENFQTIVVNDIYGEDAYEDGINRYSKEKR